MKPDFDQMNDCILFAIVMRQIDYHWIGGNVGGGNLTPLLAFQVEKQRVLSL